MSDPLLEQEPLLRPASGQTDAGAFMRNSVPQSADGTRERSSIPGSPGPAFPADRPRTTAGFKSFMGERAEGADRTRLQELRKKHGWSLFRSKNSAGGRKYRDALTASKWRYLGGSGLMEQMGKARSDRSVARAYRGGKEALRAGAGWKRFIPFTQARRDYKSAVQSFRTGRGLQSETAITPYDRLMGTRAAQRVRDRVMGKPKNAPEARPDADLLEVQGLLGQDGGQQSSPISPVTDPFNDDKPQAKGTEGSTGSESDDDDVDQQADFLLKDDDLQSQDDEDDNEAKDAHIRQLLETGDQNADGNGGPGGLSAFDHFIQQQMAAMQQEGS